MLSRPVVPAGRLFFLPDVTPFTLPYKDKKQEIPGQITQSEAAANAIYWQH